MAAMNPITLPPPGRSAYGLKGFALDYTGADAGIDGVVVQAEIDLDVDADVGFDARQSHWDLDHDRYHFRVRDHFHQRRQDRLRNSHPHRFRCRPAREQLDLSMPQSATGRCHRQFAN